MNTLDDHEAKKEIMASMMADLIGIIDSPADAQALADNLIRKGWRKAK